MPERDPWELQISGYGPQRPYVFDVLSSQWVTDATDENNPDTPRLRLIGTTDDPDFEEWTLDLRIGRKEAESWEIIENGERLVHATNPKVLSPKVSSGFGTFVTSVRKGAKAGDEELSNLVKILRTRGVPTEAAVWSGLRLVIGEQPGTFTDQDTGESRDFAQAVVIGFEGELDSDAISKFEQQKNEAREKQEKELVKVVKKSATHGEFANYAMNEMDLDDQELINDVMNPGSEGFYERHKA